MEVQEKEVKLKGVSKYAGLNVSSSKVVTLTMVMGYEEIITSVKLLQGLNTDITVLAKVGIRKPVSLGIFTVNGVNFDRDGNAKISLKSMVDNVELNNIVKLIDNEDIIQLMFKAIVGLPYNGNSDDSEDDEEEGLPFE